MSAGVGKLYPKRQIPMPEATIYNVTRDSILGDAVEIARTSKTRNKGLLGRNGIEAGGGLWIVPCEAIHMFFMKFAIDAVFLDRKKRVTKAVPALKPWRLAMSWRAHSVIELPVGVIEQSGTSRGDQIEVQKPN